jgi:hypothetical protein
VIPGPVLGSIMFITCYSWETNVDQIRIYGLEGGIPWVNVYVAI